MIKGVTIYRWMVWGLVLLTLWACVPKPRVTPIRTKIPPPPVHSPLFGEALFQKAVSVFQRGDYPRAESLYAQYFSQNPQGLNADEALYRIAQINALAQNFVKARNVYQYLIEQHPTSAFVAPARIALLDMLVKLQRFEEAIALGRQVLSLAVDEAQQFRVYMLLGEVYLTVSQPVDALSAFAAAHDLGQPADQAQALDKLQSAIHQLSSNQIQLLLNQVSHPMLRGYLMYRLGTNFVQEERLEAAAKVLMGLVSDFPDHAMADEARQMLSVLLQSGDAAKPLLGCLLPLSGPYGAFGQQALDSIVLAVHQYNQANPRQPVELKIEDTQGDDQRAVAAVRGFVEAGAAAILGPMVTAEKAAQEAQNLGIPIITFTQKDQIPYIGPYVFRNFMTFRLQARALVSYFIQVQGKKRFAILYPEETYGLDFRNLFWDEVVHQGGQVIGVEGYDPKATDFAEPIKKLTGLYLPLPEDVRQTLLRQQEQRQLAERIAAVLSTPGRRALPSDDEEPYITTDDEQPEKPLELEPIVDFDVLFIPDSPKKVGLIAPQLAFNDVRGVQLAGTNLWHTPLLLEMAGEYVQGSVLTSGFFVESRSPVVKRFVEQFQRVYGSDPGYIEAVAYDSALMLLTLLNQQDLRFRSAIRSALVTGPGWDGLCGRVKFDAHGEIESFPRLLQIKRKRFDEIDVVWTYSEATSVPGPVRDAPAPQTLTNDP